jgi:hypothetical protein
MTTFLERLTTSALLSAGAPCPPPPPPWGGTNDASWPYRAGLSRSNEPFGSIPTIVKTSPYPVALASVGATPIRSPTLLYRFVLMDEDDGDGIWYTCEQFRHSPHGC